MRRKERRIRMIETQKATKIANRPRKAKCRANKAKAVAARAATRNG